MASFTDKLFELIESIIPTSTAWIIGSLLIIVIILLWFLIKREKTFLLKEFSFSALGLKLKYELDIDKKVQILILENISLQNELKVLKTTYNKEQRRALLIVILVYIILFLDKFKLKKSDKLDGIK